MGGLLSNALNRISSRFNEKEAKILILGLDNAGKTTVLYRMYNNEVVETTPTISFNVEDIKYKNIRFQTWDLGGQTSMRPVWRCYSASSAAVIFVIDSTDTERFDLAKEEIYRLNEEEGLENAVFAIYANKQDMAKAINATELVEILELSNITNRPWQIFNTSALLGEGISEGIEWLANTIKPSAFK